MRNVLVVVDMQNDFVDQALGTEEAVQIVPAVIEEILKEKYDTVIATLDTHSEDYMATLEGKYLERKWHMGFRCCSNHKLGQAGNAGLMA